MYASEKQRKGLRSEFSRVKPSFIDSKVKFNRYGEPYWECDYCHNRIKREKIVVDHFIPLSKSHDNSFSNLRITCKKFDNSKGSKLDKCWDDLLSSKRKKKAKQTVCDTGFK